MENNVNEIVDLMWNNLDLSIFNINKPSKENLFKYINDKINYKNIDINNLTINDFISYWKLISN